MAKQHSLESGTHVSMESTELESRSREATIDVGEQATMTTISQDDAGEFNYIKGVKLRLIVTGLCLLMFLTNMEVSIVSTALVGIVKDLGGFSKSAWIVAAYLLTYIGFLIIWSKMSDIFGRKQTVCLAALLFTIFSGICGAVHTLDQLIIFRAFQGIGGSGIYSVCQIIFFELVPKEKWPAIMSLVSGVFCLSLLFGPILGGAINDGTTWRWVFLINVPVAAIGLILIVLLLPNNFPWQGRLERNKDIPRVKRIDFIGALFLLAATVLLISGLQEAGVDYAWSSPFVISVLTLSGVIWIAFFAWSFRITSKPSIVEPIFPWRFLQSRVCMATLLTGFFTGPAFSVAIFIIPQRFQVVNGYDALRAGINLLPFTVVCPVASVTAAMAAGKLKVPPLYMVIIASCLQVIGFGLLTTIPSTQGVVARQLGFEAVAGFGTGVNISTVILMIPFTAPSQDRAVAVGSLNQIRYMGGVIGLAVVATCMNSYVQSVLSGFLTEQQISVVLQSTSLDSTFSPILQDQIRVVLAEGYRLQMKILTGLAAGQIPASLLMWQSKQIIL